MRHVPHLFLPRPWPDDAITLDDSQVHHVGRVLRRQHGSEVTYTDGEGIVGSGTFRGATVERGPESRGARVRRVRAVVALPTDRDRQRFVVEKLAELGVARLSWLECRFGQGRLPREDRAQAWARSALEQSRGGWLMEIDADPVSIDQLGPDVVACDSTGSTAIPEGVDLTFAVGPEGGWAPGELPESWPRLTLGDTVLRVETAAVAAAVLVLHHP